MEIVASLIKLFFGSKADKDRKQIEPYLEKIKAVYPSIEALSNDELRDRSEALKKQIADFIARDEADIVELKAKLELPETSLEEKERISKQIDETTKRIDEKIEEKLDEILPEAFAIMKDTARRFAQNDEVVVTANDFDRDLAAEKDFVRIEGDKAIYANHWMAGGNDLKWDMIHYDVQLFGGVVLHKGKIAEMATGEGKTLVATLPVFLNALAKKGVHLVTVNNYLAKRDSEWMGPMYQFHGLSVACIDDTQPNSDARREAYMADITFGTNNEYGFDYLRDNMASSPKDLVQRKHHFAIVDEVDSVLIDDARTPLIISGPVPKGDDQMFEQYRPAIESLYNLQKNLVTALLAEARQLISEGKNDEGGVKLYRAHKGLPKYKPLIKYLSEQGVKALMQKTENTYMQDNNRRMPEITDDLYFVIDEKLNSVELTDKGHEALSKYFNEDGFFVMPDIGAEVAELEKSSLTPEEKAQKRDEVINDYSIKSERVHTVIQLLKAFAMFEKDVEYVVMDNKVKIVDEQGQTVPQGEVGELCVKGPGVMRCYYHDPEATAAVLRGEWLHTGDMAKQDEDGFYFLVDRKKDVVVSGGENIYPVQIEDFLRTNDKIKDVAVIGLPDKRLGEICGAVIELKPGVTCTEEEIQDFCMDLPRYKRPRKIIFAEIPRNATGKIEKPALRKRYGAEHLVAQQNRS